jgi:hypothetical protein
MISAITNQGKVRFKLFKGGMNAAIPIDLLKMTRQGRQEKGHPSHADAAAEVRPSETVLRAQGNRVCRLTDVFVGRVNSGIASRKQRTNP